MQQGLPCQSSNGGDIHVLHPHYFGNNIIIAANYDGID
jgi:hypothetical protein